MRFLIILAAAITASGCVSYTPTFDQPEGDPVSLHIAPVLPQEELDVQIVQSNAASSTSGQYGALGGLIAGIVDGIVNASRARKAEQRAKVLRDETFGYSLVDNLAATVEDVGTSDRWLVIATEQVEGTTKTKELAAEILETSQADAVVVVNGSYAIVPNLDQLRADITQEVYFRPGSSGSQSKRKNRSLTYLSPIHIVDYRPFKTGEKDQLKQTIEADYRQKIAANLSDEEDLEKALAEELEELENMDEIPEHIAIKETWPGPRLVKYLDQAKLHLAAMLNIDWSTSIAPDSDSVEKVKFKTVSEATGMPITQSGVELRQTETHSIYRSSSGDLYSIPR